MRFLSADRFALLIHLALGFVIILATTVLGALHDLSPQAIATIFGFAVGLLGGAGATVVMFSQATNGKAIVPTERITETQVSQAHLSEQLARLETTVNAALAASSATAPRNPQPVQNPGDNS